jgi:DNA-binding NtrC family response regulator
MAANSLVLMFGRDSLLLQTRQWLLQSVGYRAHIARELAEVEDVLSRGEVELLVLCHTLAGEECEQAIALLQRWSPSAKCLVLTANGCSCLAALCEESTQARDGPRKFVAKVTTLMKSVALALPMHS